MYLQVILSALTLLSLPACDDNGGYGFPDNEDTAVELQFSFTIEGHAGNLKSLKNHFEEGDEIALSPAKETAVRDAYRVRNMGSYWYSQEPVYIGSASTNVYAVYPYSPLQTGDSRVQLDHTSQTDILAGKGVCSSENFMVTIKMFHVLSQVRFRLHKGDYTGEGIINEISIENAPGKTALYSYGYFDIESGLIIYEEREGHHQPALITRYEMYPDYISESYPDEDQYPSVLLIPLSELENDGDVVFRFRIDGQDLIYPLPGGTVFGSGKRYTYDVTMQSVGEGLKNSNPASPEWTVSVEKQQD